MNPSELKYITRAIEDHGVPLSSNLLWFIDEGKTYYAVQVDGKVEYYISGHITGRVFAMDYTSARGNIDTMYWKDFLLKHFDLKIIDTRL